MLCKPLKQPHPSLGAHLPKFSLQILSPPFPVLGCTLDKHTVGDRLHCITHQLTGCFTGNLLMLVQIRVWDVRKAGCMEVCDQHASYTPATLRYAHQHLVESLPGAFRLTCTGSPVGTAADTPALLLHAPTPALTPHEDTSGQLPCLPQPELSPGPKHPARMPCSQAVS